MIRSQTDDGTDMFDPFPPYDSAVSDEGKYGVPMVSMSQSQSSNMNFNEESLLDPNKERLPEDYTNPKPPFEDEDPNNNSDVENENDLEDLNEEECDAEVLQITGKRSSIQESPAPSGVATPANEDSTAPAIETVDGSLQQNPNFEDVRNQNAQNADLPSPDERPADKSCDSSIPVRELSPADPVNNSPDQLPNVQPISPKPSPQVAAGSQVSGPDHSPVQAQEDSLHDDCQSPSEDAPLVAQTDSPIAESSPVTDRPLSQNAEQMEALLSPQSEAECDKEVPSACNTEPTEVAIAIDDTPGPNEEAADDCPPVIEVASVCLDLEEEHEEFVWHRAIVIRLVTTSSHVALFFLDHCPHTAKETTCKALVIELHLVLIGSRFVIFLLRYKYCLILL